MPIATPVPLTGANMELGGVVPRYELGGVRMLEEELKAIFENAAEAASTGRRELTEGSIGNLTVSWRRLPARPHMTQMRQSGTKSLSNSSFDIFQLGTDFLDMTKAVEPLLLCLETLPTKYHLIEMLKKALDVPRLPYTLQAEYLDPPLQSVGRWLDGLESKYMSNEYLIEVDLGALTSDTNGDEKCARALAGELHCDADAGNPNKRMPSKIPESPDDAFATFHVYVRGEREVCVRRTNGPVATWNFPLAIQCKDKHQHQNVVIGSSVENKKCLMVEASADLSCLTYAGNQGYRKNAENNQDPSSAAFEISVQQGQGGSRSVCAQRLDTEQGWTMPLTVTCFASSLVGSFSGLSDGSWKAVLMDDAMGDLHDLANMPGFELMSCGMRHIIDPVVQMAKPVVMDAFRVVDDLILSFTNSIGFSLGTVLKGLVEVLGLGATLDDLNQQVIGKSAEACDATVVEVSGQLSRGEAVGLSASLRLLMNLLPEVAASVMEGYMHSASELLIGTLVQPLMRWIISQLQLGLRAGLESLTGLCGLIPEVGGPICMFFTAALTAAEETICPLGSICYFGLYQTQEDIKHTMFIKVLRGV